MTNVSQAILPLQKSSFTKVHLCGHPGRPRVLTYYMMRFFHRHRQSGFLDAFCFFAASADAELMMNNLSTWSTIHGA
jgi:hypothetical protein